LGAFRRARGEGASAPDGPSGVEWLVVGLGNPGAEYARSRHNVGAEVVEALSRRHGGGLRRAKDLVAVVDDVRLDGRRIARAVPQTYMNDSGRSVRLLVRRYGIQDLARLVVVHDELDLPPGALRVKAGGGLAGHNGLRSLRDHLHGTDFLRVRIGVGKPASKERGAAHVLNRVPKAERELLDVAVERAADAVEAIALHGAARAMQDWNRAEPGT
jgi:peptidyl-tRNA hydrolase, PTH1 family